MRILLVRSENQTTGSLLVNSGYTLIHTQSVDQTLKCLTHFKGNVSKSAINCIMVNIPSSEWLALCQSIRSNKMNAQVPIVAVMGDRDFGLLSELMAAGVTDFMVEPFQGKELTARLEFANRTQTESGQNQHSMVQYYGDSCNSRDLFRDLIIAKNLQKSVLSEPINLSNLEIEATYIPAEVLAGDLYCWFPIDDTRYGIMVLDVMGHGIASSLIGMSVRSLLRGMIIRLVYPESIVKELNKHMLNLYENMNETTTYYFTMIYLMINTDNQEIHYVNAGHPPGLVISRDGTAKRLTEGCVPIGLIPEISVVTGKLTYKKDMRLLLYTDGIFENTGLSLTEGIASLEKNMQESMQLDLKQFLNHLVSHAPVDPQDDICLVGIDIRSR